VYKPEAPFAQKIFQDQDIKIMTFDDANGYLLAMPSLSVLNLPRSILDIPTDTPEKPIRVISPVAELVMNEEFHPALVSLIIREIKEVINDPTIGAKRKYFS
jgi:hypothetical protein